MTQHPPIGLDTDLGPLLLWLCREAERTDLSYLSVLAVYLARTGQ
jgi:hypothetical protein